LFTVCGADLPCDTIEAWTNINRLNDERQAMPELITRRDRGIGWIIFSNPAKYNALTVDMWRALPEALDAFERDPEVHVIVLSGDGDKAFVSGADISQFEQARGSKDGQAEYDRLVQAAYEAPTRCAKPVIAKIRGICIGGGLGLAAACDIRIAAEDAVFRMPAARMGLGYNYTGVKRFVDVMGPGNTSDIFFSARKFDAADALRMGLVSRVIPVAEFDREVLAYAELVAENAPLTMSAAKRAIAEALKETDGGLAAVQAMVDACFASNDFREGRTAFMAKRKPVFKGR
jgi:enoyl-CoA hydratase